MKNRDVCLACHESKGKTSLMFFNHASLFDRLKINFGYQILRIQCVGRNSILARIASLIEILPERLDKRKISIDSIPFDPYTSTNFSDLMTAKGQRSRF